MFIESFSKFAQDFCFEKSRNLAFCIHAIHKHINDSMGLPIKSYPATCAKYERIRANCSVKKGEPATCKLPTRTNRCTATTGKGRQCSRDQVAGCLYCGQHIFSSK